MADAKRHYTAEGDGETVGTHLKKVTVKGRELFCDESVAHFDWLVSQGAQDHTGLCAAERHGGRQG